jgi:hypothetical protein
MFETPKLRKIANSNGGSTMMLSDCQQANSSEGVFVLGEAVFSAETIAPRSQAAGKGSAARDHDGHARAGGGLDPADTRGARLASLSSSDREVFNRWAKWVIALYALLFLGLATAMLLGAQAAADRGAVASSSEHAPSHAPGRPGR